MSTWLGKLKKSAVELKNKASSASQKVKKASGDFLSEHLDSKRVFKVNGTKYKSRKNIAEGGYGFVHLVENEAGDLFALKHSFLQTQEQLKSAQIEIDVLRKLPNEPNVVNLIDAEIIRTPGKPGAEACVVMELCPGGSLADQINARVPANLGGLPEKQIKEVMWQVCSAVSKLHSLQPPIIHRDIKAENVLIAADGVTYKLCDFGSCQEGVLLPNSDRARSEIQEQIDRFTTLAYRSPEMVDLYMEKPINEKADVWALGCLLYKCCFLLLPFDDGASRLAILNAKLDWPANLAAQYSPELLQLIRTILQPDPDLRPDVWEVLRQLAALRGVSAPPAPAPRPITSSANHNSFASTTVDGSLNSSSSGPQLRNSGTLAVPNTIVGTAKSQQDLFNALEWEQDDSSVSSSGAEPSLSSSSHNSVGHKRHGSSSRHKSHTRTHSRKNSQRLRDDDEDLFAALSGGTSPAVSISVNSSSASPSSATSAQDALLFDFVALDSADTVSEGAKSTADHTHIRTSHSLDWASFEDDFSAPSSSPSLPSAPRTPQHSGQPRSGLSSSLEWKPSPGGRASPVPSTPQPPGPSSRLTAPAFTHRRSVSDSHAVFSPSDQQQQSQQVPTLHRRRSAQKHVVVHSVSSMGSLPLSSSHSHSLTAGTLSAATASSSTSTSAAPPAMSEEEALLQQLSVALEQSLPELFAAPTAALALTSTSSSDAADAQGITPFLALRKWLVLSWADYAQAGLQASIAAQMIRLLPMTDALDPSSWSQQQQQQQQQGAESPPQWCLGCPLPLGMPLLLLKLSQEGSPAVLQQILSQRESWRLSGSPAAAAASPVATLSYQMWQVLHAKWALHAAVPELEGSLSLDCYFKQLREQQAKLKIGGTASPLRRQTVTLLTALCDALQPLLDALLRTASNSSNSNSSGSDWQQCALAALLSEHWAALLLLQYCLVKLLATKADLSQEHEAYAGLFTRFYTLTTRTKTVLPPLTPQLPALPPVPPSIDRGAMTPLPPSLHPTFLVGPPPLTALPRLLIPDHVALLTQQPALLALYTTLVLGWATPPPPAVAPPPTAVPPAVQPRTPSPQPPAAAPVQMLFEPFQEFFAPTTPTSSSTVSSSSVVTAPPQETAVPPVVIRQPPSLSPSPSPSPSTAMTSEAKLAQSGAVEAQAAELKAIQASDAANQVCADCGERAPSWASINQAVFLCYRCAGVHRSLGTHISQVRSLQLDAWTPAQVAAMRRGGNRRGNARLEALLSSAELLKPTKHSDQSLLERFIRDKYQFLRFAAPE